MLANFGIAIAAGDVRAFLHGNWQFQAFVASVSPNTMLRTVFLSLLDLLERHAVTLRPVNAQPLPEVLNARLDLYVRMANALEARDRTAVTEIMIEHNTGTQPAAEPAT